MPKVNYVSRKTQPLLAFWYSLYIKLWTHVVYSFHNCYLINPSSWIQPRTSNYAGQKDKRKHENSYSLKLSNWYEIQHFSPPQHPSPWEIVSHSDTKTPQQNALGKRITVKASKTSSMRLKISCRYNRLNTYLFLMLENALC